jgi:hypothetical protein
MERLAGIWNGSRTLYFQCDHIDRVKLGSPTYQNESIHCNGDAGWLVIQEGELTGNRFSLHLCERHMKPFVQGAWKMLGDTSVDEEENIDVQFLQFKPGTHREEIWHWFEDELDTPVYDLFEYLKKEIGQHGKSTTSE